MFDAFDRLDEAQHETIYLSLRARIDHLVAVKATAPDGTYAADEIAKARDLLALLGDALALAATIREALEGDSNDAEHDALVEAARALGVEYTV